MKPFKSKSLLLYLTLAIGLSSSMPTQAGWFDWIGKHWGKITAVVGAIIVLTMTGRQRAAVEKEIWSLKSECHMIETQIDENASKINTHMKESLPEIKARAAHFRENAKNMQYAVLVLNEELKNYIKEDGVTTDLEQEKVTKEWEENFSRRAARVAAIAIKPTAQPDSSTPSLLPKLLSPTITTQPSQEAGWFGNHWDSMVFLTGAILIGIGMRKACLAEGINNYLSTGLGLTYSGIPVAFWYAIKKERQKIKKTHKKLKETAFQVKETSTDIDAVNDDLEHLDASITEGDQVQEDRVSFYRNTFKKLPHILQEKIKQKLSSCLPQQFIIDICGEERDKQTLNVSNSREEERNTELEQRALGHRPFPGATLPFNSSTTTRKILLSSSPIPPRSSLPSPFAFSSSPLSSSSLSSPLSSSSLSPYPSPSSSCSLSSNSSSSLSSASAASTTISIIPSTLKIIQNRL